MNTCIYDFRKKSDVAAWLLNKTSPHKVRDYAVFNVDKAKNFDEVVHRRTKIDRFTGGTLQGMLFTTKAAYQKISDVPVLKMHFGIRDAKDFGRGTISGLSAEMSFDVKTYKLGANGKILLGDKTELEKSLCGKIKSGIFIAWQIQNIIWGKFDGEKFFTPKSLRARQRKFLR